MHIPYGKQDITDEDVRAVLEVLRADFITQGPQIENFETSLSSYVGSKYATAMSSATAALHLACLALELGPGDTLWTSPNTFVASANCALYCGANVDFVDIDPDTYNMSAHALEEKLKRTVAEQLPKVVVPVHFAGQSCDMREIWELSKKYGFKIIEDASHAIGGQYESSSIGGCLYSDIAVFSFHPVKIITTGEGGVATTNDVRLFERMALLRSHGITRDKVKMCGDGTSPWYYEQQELGFNYRMTDLQAALGVSQLSRINDNITRRHAIKAKYDRELTDLPIILPKQLEDRRSSLHLYPIQIDSEKTNKDRKDVFLELRQKNIGVNVHYIPVYLQPFYREKGFQPGLCPQSELYYKRAISLPMFHSMKEDQHEKTINALKEILL